MFSIRHRRDRRAPGVAALAALLSVHAWAADATPPGIPNFHRVNENLSRGGQPTRQAWSALAALGVKTVIDLRQEGEHSTRAEESAVRAAGMRYINVPLGRLGAPPAKKVAQILALLDAAPPEHIFVHCLRGSDRTGTVIACYRIAHDHWENRWALEEAKAFGMSWLEFAMRRFVLNFRAPP